MIMMIIIIIIIITSGLLRAGRLVPRAPLRPVVGESQRHGLVVFYLLCLLLILLILLMCIIVVYVHIHIHVIFPIHIHKSRRHGLKMRGFPAQGSRVWLPSAGFLQAQVCLSLYQSALVVARDYLCVLRESCTVRMIVGVTGTTTLSRWSAWILSSQSEQR